MTKKKATSVAELPSPMMSALSSTPLMDGFARKVLLKYFKIGAPDLVHHLVVSLLK